MFKIFIAEDEIKTLNYITKIIDDFCDKAVITEKVQTVKDAIEYLTSEKPDLLLLDINFPDGTAFDILEKTDSENLKIIFITAFEEYALKAIKLSAVDYFLKPVNPKELIATIKELQNKKNKKEQHQLLIDTLLSNIKNEKNRHKKVVLKTAERILVVNIYEIIRCEAEGSYSIFVMTENRKIIVSKPLKDFEDILPDDYFLRTHKSHLVNTDFIESFEKSGGGYIILKDKTKIPVSVRKKEFIINKINEI